MDWRPLANMLIDIIRGQNLTFSEARQVLEEALLQLGRCHLGERKPPEE